MDRQRLTTERYVDQMRDSLEKETERREFGVLVSVIVILVGIDHAVAELSHRTSVDISSQSFSWGALLSFGGVFVLAALLLLLLRVDREELPGEDPELAAATS